MIKHVILICCGVLIGCSSGTPVPSKVEHSSVAVASKAATVDTKPVIPTKAAFTLPPIMRPNNTIYWLEQWTIASAMNARRNLTNQFVDDALKAAPEVPYIRMRCKKLFNTEVFTTQTIESLKDWLVVEYKLDAQVIANMSLEEVKARLEYKE